MTWKKKKEIPDEIFEDLEVKAKILEKERRRELKLAREEKKVKYRHKFIVDKDT